MNGETIWKHEGTDCVTFIIDHGRLSLAVIQNVGPFGDGQKQLRVKCIKWTLDCLGLKACLLFACQQKGASTTTIP